MADKDGQSQPDKTNADNPSGTGTPTVSTQSNNTVAHDNGSTTYTRTYGSDSQSTSQSAPNTKGETLDQFAERGVVERHGEAIRQNPQFKELVKEEKRQIQENAENTKGM